MNERSPIQPLEWTDELVASLWEYFGDFKPEAFFTANCGDRILQLTERFLPASATICDYGCGKGFLLKKILASHKAAGVDFSRNNLESVQADNAENSNFVGAYSIDQLAEIKLKFDVVYFIETVEHLLDHHVAPTFQAIEKLLKPGGVVICTTPNEENLADTEVYCPVTRRTFHQYQHVRSFSGETLAALFAEHHFSCIATFTTDFFANSLRDRLKIRLRPYFRKRNPHLVYVGSPQVR
ncbi:MAG: class I SAM-dependent methyltransferase [Rhodospirillales bacterium]|jgi:2-polyprenyl-3-methyl-5-hydroxy-6-metoxy-1,4-benzoquinol methylase|nr:class I SAM-dependent methyltransferase [Rhodospirillales bacterium]